MADELSKDAKVMLLILAANGGTMDEPDIKREFERVVKLSPTDFAVWRERIIPLVRENAQKHLRGEL